MPVIQYATPTFPRILTVFTFCIFLFTSHATGKGSGAEAERVPSIKHRNALIILPGLGTNAFKECKIKKFYSNQGYDIFIPAYHSRTSLESSVEKLKAYFNKNKIEEYDTVNVFAFILGSWANNLFLQKYPYPNIRSIVYDRSPLQERAPYIFARYLPILAWIARGNAIRDLSQTPYPIMPDTAITIGIIIENRATPFIRWQKKHALAMGEILWSDSSLGQRNNDFIYTRLNHDQMYEQFDAYGNEVLYFFRHGKFTPNALRTPLSGDPFSADKR
jgi:hypothetical protein